MGVVAKTGNSARMFELDAVGGIASLIVVFDHFSELFYRRKGVSIDDPVSLLKATPFGVLVQGSSAVITFFVLSGFVLSIPFRAEDHSISWPRFVCKRILRLYLPFVVALALASAADSAFSTHGIPTLNAWFNSSWSRPINLRDLVSHAFLVNHFDYTEYNKAFWTLAYEMQMSLIFPLLYCFGAKLKEYLPYVCFVLMVLGTAKIPGVDVQIVYLLSAAGLFLLGITLSRNSSYLEARMSRVSLRSRRILTVAVLFVFAYGGVLARGTSWMNLSPALIAIASSVTILMALSDQVWRKFLNLPVCQFLGKVSYSLYLVHLTVLYSLIYLTHTHASSGAYWVAFFPTYVLLSLSAAWIYFMLVERVCISLSQLVRLKSVSRTLTPPPKTKSVIPESSNVR
jgi:peptidoglycan/LPS O-acetylase OafA/YrhL